MHPVESSCQNLLRAVLSAEGLDRQLLRSHLGLYQCHVEPLPFASFSPGGSSPPTHLLILEVTSPVSRHPRIHGNIRNSSVGLSTQTCSLRAGRWRGFPSQEVRPTSSRHTGVGGIRLFWDSASDGPPSEGGAIPSELLGAESRITPLPCSRSSCSDLSCTDLRSELTQTRSLKSENC